MNRTDAQNTLCKPAFDNLPEEKRKRILRVARQEFAENGFENTAISQIAQKSDISVGAVYKYFDNKEQLFSYIMHEGLSKLENMLMELAPSDEDILLKAEKIIRTLLAFSKEQPELIQLYCSLTTGGNTELLNQLSQRIEAVTASIYTQTISIAQETGEVRKDINPAVFAFLMDNVFMMLQFSSACPYYKERYFIYTGKQIEDSEELVVEQTLLFLKAAFNFK